MSQRLAWLGGYNRFKIDIFRGLTGPGLLFSAWVCLPFFRVQFLTQVENKDARENDDPSAESRLPVVLTVSSGALRWRQKDMLREATIR